ncbi:hypothetical protein BC831DRAFT_450006 [Entophlyctis helioformis]|nr:hypothetical protein BC831DRAFT_450006 [Entophlyctis helioformis]
MSFAGLPCAGCSQRLGVGEVITCSDAYYHVACFKCSGCAKTLNAANETILLAEDGKPLCTACSYQCEACNQPILESAISTGTHTYHADCFRCILCLNAIDGLTYALHENHLYCVACYRKKRLQHGYQAWSSIDAADQVHKPAHTGSNNSSKQMGLPPPSLNASIAESPTPTTSSLAFKHRLNHQTGEEKPPISPALTQPDKTDTESTKMLNAATPTALSDQPRHALDKLKGIREKEVANTDELQAKTRHRTGTSPKEQEQEQEHQQRNHGDVSMGAPQESTNPAPLHSSFSFESNASHYMYSSNMRRRSSGMLSGRVSQIHAEEDGSTELGSVGEYTSVDRRASSKAVIGMDHAGSLDTNQLRADLANSQRNARQLQDMIALLQDQLHEQKLGRQDAEARLKLCAAELDTLRTMAAKSMASSYLDKAIVRQTAEAARLKDEIDELGMQRSVLAQDVHQSIQHFLGLLSNKQVECAGELTATSQLLIETFQQDIENLKERRKGLFDDVEDLHKSKQTARQEFDIFLKDLVTFETPPVLASLESARQSIDQHNGVLNESGQHQSLRSVCTSEYGSSRPLSCDYQLRDDSSGQAAACSPSKRSSMRPIGRSITEYKRDDEDLSPAIASPSQQDGCSPAKRTSRRERSKTVSSKANDVGKETIKWANDLKNNILKAAGGLSSKKQSPYVASSDLLDTATQVADYPHALAGASSVSAMSAQSGKAKSPAGEGGLAVNTSKADRTLERPYHRFLPHSYLSPKKCDCCNEKLWGKELRCDLCGYHCHSKCSSSVHGSCMPSTVISIGKALPTAVVGVATQAQTSVFGVDLIQQLRLEGGGDVPKFVVQCIEHVEQHGLEYEGVYRKSGPVVQINKIVAAVNRGDPLVFQDESCHFDVTAVTSALKQYFRELPDSLVSSSIYTDLIDCVRTQIDDERNATFKELLRAIPREHFSTLAYLIKHLFRVHELAAKNLMVASNLGVVFGPTLLKPPIPSTQLDLVDSGARGNVVEHLILNAHEFFT